MRLANIRSAPYQVVLIALGISLFWAGAAFSQCCIEPDNGSGTATMPAGCSYLGPMRIVDGLASGSQININAAWGSFNSVVETPGGGLGGTTSSFLSTIQMQMTGTGSLSGFSRTITIPLTNSFIDWAPRTAFSPVQTFNADLLSFQGQVTSDPDFDLLRITAGRNFGLISPGLAQLVQSGSSWTVNGFFDITYRIDFIGASTSTWLGGRSGSTTHEDRLQICDEALPAVATTWGRVKALYHE